jgi:hypothetical protein
VADRLGASIAANANHPSLEMLWGSPGTMHAIAQSEHHAEEYRMRRYSLWTGDPGLALYLWNCLSGDDRWPNLDREDDG